MRFKHLFAVFGMSIGLAFGLSGCFGGKNMTVDIKGNETEIRITAPSGYDTLSVAEGHCRSFKKKAIFNGRGEGQGGITVTNFRCTVR